jgi:hypothetical protein
VSVIARDPIYPWTREVHTAYGWSDGGVIGMRVPGRKSRVILAAAVVGGRVAGGGSPRGRVS